MSHWLDAATHQVLRFNRVWRLVLVALFAVATTLLLTPLVDGIYIEYFFAPETRGLPALISSALGVVVYALGWWLLIGADAVPRFRRWATWYLIAGIVVLVTAVVLIVDGALQLAQE